MRKTKETIPIFYPYVTSKQRKAVNDVLKTRWIGQGPKTDEFEKKFEDRFNAKYAVSVNSGSAALETACDLADLKEGDKVIVTPLTCLYGEESVLMENNKFCLIRQLVNNRSDKKVISFNTYTGLLETKRIIGWYKLRRDNKKWINVSHKLARNSRRGKVGAWVTEDHKILTTDGWIYARDLAVGKHKLILKEPNLNIKQLSVFNGMMLGDGYIRNDVKNGVFGRLGCLHTKSQEEWCLLKRNVFSGFDSKISYRKAYKQSKSSVGFMFHSYIIFDQLRHRWYSNRKKVIPTDFSLDLISLVIWYLDDGCRQNNAATFCTERYSKKDVKKLVSELRKFGLEPTINTSRSRLRIYIGSTGNSERLFNLIAPFVPPSMQYKLPEQYRQKFDVKLWDCGKADRFTDEVVVKLGNPKNRRDKYEWVYCIDVEDNHNFISKNIIMHNCTASNLPLIRRGCKLIWADIRKDTLNLDNEDVQQKMKDNPDVKAIMNVHLGGIESDICDPFVIVINDAAQALGIYRPQNDYNCYSFQAIKHITTGDGGMITVNDEEKYKKAKLLRWFGIDRERKKKNNWQAFKEREMVFDIEIPGHKRQMTDIAASMGIAGLEDYDKILNYRKKIFDIYKLIKVDGFTLVDGEKNVYWLATVLVDKRDDFVKKLHDYKIETNLVQIRNDIFNIFGGKRQDLPNMNWVEDRYISIPLHNKMTIKDALYIKKVIESGW